jgi:RNA polymerase sigma-70 factor (ECF subfamily)
MSKELSDSELVKQVVGGDRDAYRALFDKYHGRVLSLAFDVLRSREEAQDVAQEAFVKAYLSLPDFKGDSTFYTWLYRIAYNLAVDVKRKIARRGGPPAEFEESAAVDADLFSGGLVGHVQGPHAALYQKEQHAHIKLALASLTEEHRVTIVLREVDGLSYEEIAKVTGASLGTVMSRLFYARKKLQKALHEVDPANFSANDSSGDGPPGKEGGGSGRAAEPRRGSTRLGMAPSGKKGGSGRLLQRAPLAIGGRHLKRVFSGFVNILRSLCVRVSADRSVLAVSSNS